MYVPSSGNFTILCSVIKMFSWHNAVLMLLSVKVRKTSRLGLKYLLRPPQTWLKLSKNTKKKKLGWKFFCDLLKNIQRYHICKGWIALILHHHMSSGFTFENIVAEVTGLAALSPVTPPMSTPLPCAKWLIFKKVHQPVVKLCANLQKNWEANLQEHHQKR